MYLEVAYNDWTWKLGRFYGINGYEVVPAPYNFFYTHSYSFAYGQPLTHTGALGEYRYSDETTFYAGYTMGWDGGWENQNDAHTAIGGIRMDWWQDATLTYTFTAGNYGGPRAPLAGGVAIPDEHTGDIFHNSLILEYQLTNAWQYVFEGSIGAQTGVAGARDAHWYGTTHYLFYDINCCWSMGIRAEWFNDEDGARIGRGFASRGDYYSFGVGFNYQPNANLIIRPEVRADYFEATQAGGMTVLPFDGGAEDEQLTLGIDAIYTF